MMKVYLLETDDFSAVVFTDGKTAKVKHTNDYGEVDGVDLYNETAIKNLRKVYMKLWDNGNMNSYDEIYTDTVLDEEQTEELMHDRLYGVCELFEYGEEMLENVYTEEEFTFEKLLKLSKENLEDSKPMDPEELIDPKSFNDYLKEWQELKEELEKCDDAYTLRDILNNDRCYYELITSAGSGEIKVMKSREIGNWD